VALHGVPILLPDVEDRPAVFVTKIIVQDRLFESDFDRVVAETKRLGEGTPRKGKKP
jgi:hypothetical protein